MVWAGCGLSQNPCEIHYLIPVGIHITDKLLSMKISPTMLSLSAEQEIHNINCH